MANINYKTTEKPAVQRAVCEAIDWIGFRETSYAEIARQAKCLPSDCRYAILDLLDKGYLKRIQTKGYANATRGFRYAYSLTEQGKQWITATQAEVAPTKNNISGLFK